MKQARSERDVAQRLARRLRERRGEIEEAALLRVNAVAPLPRAAGPEYAEGLRAAVSAGLEYGIEGIERGEEVAVPAQLLDQARLAADSRVGLDTVLRRYVAGHALLWDFVVQEAGGASPEEMKRLVRRLAAIVDRLLAVVSVTYEDERDRRARSSERRRTERIERLVAGEPLDVSSLGYDFDAHHLGLLASGPRAEPALTGLAASLDARLLALPRDDGLHWAWLGSRRGLDPERVKEIAVEEFFVGLTLAIGEPEQGVAGWRFTHRQARAALAVALRGGEPIVRYADVALVASAMQDELLVKSLRRLYLEPLERQRGGGKVARQTLRAYFATGGNVSSAAAILKVERRTVANRLRAIEEKIGHPLSSCAVELSIALRLMQLPAHELSQFE